MALHKHLAVIQIALRQQLVQREQLLGRFFLYIVIVYLFYQVFGSVGAPSDRLWYLAITEWLILSTAPLALQIADDVNGGQIVYFMLRPMHYLSLRFCEAIGTSLVRFIILGVSCIGFGFYLTARFPGSISTWIIGLLLGILGLLLYSLILTLIGLLSFWLKDIKSLLYLNLTATFCFGGLIVPLNFYSEWVRAISLCTPYPWILWGPAEHIIGGEINLWVALCGWGVWMLIIGGAIGLVYQKCLKSFVVEGG